MVLVHSFYLLGAVSFVQCVVAQEFLGSQPLLRLANGFIVEYADDPQTHSEVSRSFMMSDLRFTERGSNYESLWAVPVLAIWTLLVHCCCLAARAFEWHTSAAGQAGFHWAVSANESILKPMAAANMI